MTRLEPIRPGEVLKHDYMDPFGLSATALARAIGVTPARINEIVNVGRHEEAPDAAFPLGRITMRSGLGPALDSWRPGSDTPPASPRNGMTLRVGGAP